MKNTVFALLITPILLSACGGAADDHTEENVKTDTVSLDFSDMKAFSFEDYGLDLEVLLPQVESSTGNSIDPTVDHEDGDYLWYLSIGPRFNLVVEDFGKDFDKVKNEKDRLDDLSDIFVVEYLVDEPNLIMYRRTLHKDQGGTKSYHCYGEVKIGDYNYVLKSQDEGGLKPIIEDMVMTIRSAKSLMNKNS
ncbi:hypothetical protein [Crocinitomix algicola]|uniref:hypothetical protein n=1 Tax=Crocinitomix algicola TaxID=1740263 RepID=UPI0008723E10|nr:hypothetical protein [Crocinitomix algicola]